MSTIFIPGMIFTPDAGENWTHSIPRKFQVGEYNEPTKKYIKEEDWQWLANRGVFREVIESGNDYNLGYAEHEIIPNPAPDDNIAVAYKAINGTQKEQVEAQRQELEDEIENQVASANATEIQLLGDPGLLGAMHEAFHAGEAAKDRLSAATDLDNFDPTLNVHDVTGPQIARTLAIQERRLSNDPVMSPTQQADLAASAQMHEDYLAAGSTGAVTAPPVSARRFIGTPGEERGYVEVERVANVPNMTQWTLTFRFVLDRLNMGVSNQPNGYFIAMYDETGELEVMPTGTDSDEGYRSTAHLTDMGDGVWVADRAAVADWGPEYVERRFTLCRGHITQPVLALMVFPAEAKFKRFPLRYLGNVTIPTNYVDSGVQVTGIVSGSTFNVDDTGPLESLPANHPIQINGIETQLLSVFTPGKPGIITVKDHHASYVGNNIWIAQ